MAEERASSAMSTPAAKTRSEPPRTTQRTASSRSSSWSVVTSCSMSASESAFSASGRLRRTTAIGSSRSTRTSSFMRQPNRDPPRRAPHCSLFLVQEALDRGLRLLGRHREREPVASMVDRLVPREVFPEVQVLLRIARRLRQLPREVVDDSIDLGIELGCGYDPVHEPPH